MYDRVGGKRVARRARVVAGVRARRALDVQRALLVRQVGRDVHAPVDVVVDHAAVVVPEYVHRVDGALPDHALQVQRAVEHQILLRSAGDLGLRLCEHTPKTETRQFFIFCFFFYFFVLLSFFSFLVLKTVRFIFFTRIMNDI